MERVEGLMRNLNLLTAERKGIRIKGGGERERSVSNMVQMVPYEGYRL
jgi:hypothetical protein